MTKDDLRKEATETVEWECIPMVDRLLFIHGYITGAEPRQKRVEELEKENAKLKELLRNFLNAKSIEETCVAESEADKFLREVENV